MLVHWVLAEAEEVDPKTAPLVVWYQGGPGASSLFGFFVEFGPFMLNDESLQNEAFNKTGVPQLIRNPYSWNKVRGGQSGKGWPTAYSEARRAAANAGAPLTAFLRRGKSRRDTASLRRCMFQRAVTRLTIRSTTRTMDVDPEMGSPETRAQPSFLPTPPASVPT